MKLFLLFILLVFSACSNSISLEKRTDASYKEPFLIYIAEPNAPGNFYYRLYDSLDRHIYAINRSGLTATINGDEDKDEFLGWLFEQFEDASSGISKKAPSKIDKDRTSEEVKLKNTLNSRTDKFSFTANFRVDSIPEEYLYPDLWKKATASNKFEKELQTERERFAKGGRLIRTNQGIKDTLFVYAYKLPVDISLNYYSTEEKRWFKSIFTILAETGVYHQLKFK
ncbi:hypothetical protein L3C95_01070 [Chitinophaga filiformis]|uniref:hypothetical protein n=1 Tax=Chitinophaga filiformis TaxID=104663 RepID=UPI001F25DB0A|nr:hypothetical protein [Chitinophaga filiformis]MCF6401442.1 hypothetical protein [Chitinophaga filiformis]